MASFLLLNQTFFPDHMATGQYLSEVALALAEQGHKVTVVTSNRAYDDPSRRFANRESWRGVEIHRVSSTTLGKSARWRRAADFASFIVSCLWRLVFTPRHDVVVALTTPPLISFIGACLASLRSSRFIYWVMDMNPDEAIAAGWLREGSMAARILEWMSRFSFRHAHRIIALDRFMADRITAKDIPATKIVVVPPWSHDSEIRFDPAGRARFRKAHGLENRFVVMYSGNHSPVHPLGTLLKAAEQLQSNSGITFAFVGGGSEWRNIQAQLARTRIEGGQSQNILCLPYQPFSELSASLSAADLHVVVMGDAMLGLVHPCKIYNMLSIGAPILYIGPSPSHVTEIFAACQNSKGFKHVAHGDVQAAADHVKLQAAEFKDAFDAPRTAAFRADGFSKKELLPRLLAAVVDP